MSLVSPDGVAATQQGDGTWQWIADDGEVHYFDARGRQVVTVTPAEISEVDLDTDYSLEGCIGGFRAHMADGRVTTWHLDGEMIQEDSDGSTTTLSAADVSTRVDEDGTQTVITADGRKTVTREDGSSEVTSADGTESEWVYSDGTRQAVEGSNSCTWTFSEGTKLLEAADGSVLTTFTDGATVRRDGYGRLWEHLAGAPAESRYELADPIILNLSNGVHMVWEADGTVRIEWPDGRFREVGLRGVICTGDGAGNVTRATATGVVITLGCLWRHHDSPVGRDYRQPKHDHRHGGYHPRRLHHCHTRWRRHTGGHPGLGLYSHDRGQRLHHAGAGRRVHNHLVARWYLVSGDDRRDDRHIGSRTGPLRRSRPLATA